MKFFIVKGKNTGGHGPTLEGLGYQVRDGEDWDGNPAFVIEANGFVERLDLRDKDKAREAIDEIIREKKLLTYGSKILTEKGIRVGIRGGTQYLEGLATGLSCLVAKTKEVFKPKKPRKPSVAEFLGLSQ